jgi:hypothetical protein
MYKPSCFFWETESGVYWILLPIDLLCTLFNVVHCVKQRTGGSLLLYYYVLLAAISLYLVL